MHHLHKRRSRHSRAGGRVKVVARAVCHDFAILHRIIKALQHVFEADV